MATITIPVTEYNEWRTNELVFTQTLFPANFPVVTHTALIPNDGRVQLIFKITHDAPGEMYLTVRTRGLIDGLDINDINPIVIPRTDSHGADRELLYCVGPFDPPVFNNADGYVEVDYIWASGSSNVHNHYYLAAIRS